MPLVGVVRISACQRARTRSLVLGTRWARRALCAVGAGTESKLQSPNSSSVSSPPDHRRSRPRGRRRKSPRAGSRALYRGWKTLPRGVAMHSVLRR
uniref:Uncharacterized protein n=1 Tax=Hyaloperonospora arabidopsidis (strain Emoy2) TaxID=559515 RepID=M4BHH5_HYAAE